PACDFQLVGDRVAPLAQLSARLPPGLVEITLDAYTVCTSHLDYRPVLEILGPIETVVGLCFVARRETKLRRTCLNVLIQHRPLHRERAEVFVPANPTIAVFLESTVRLDLLFGSHRLTEVQPGILKLPPFLLDFRCHLVRPFCTVVVSCQFFCL